ncbi:hypothetical protein COK65_18485 [Bacillus thuringiensis]|uniref:hypothetical protein n=1 Tax=Bacillus thuringiensis TaxID=1428 RepID=UPI000BF73ED6|nr:hypothetical protein [Bacillus thuringiensis]PFS40746.1 hypothetical protein COK65_18485 [Bacillus thuringiensis]
MLQGFPKSAAFDPSRVGVFSARWEFKRKAGQEGKNVGENFLVPSGSVVVGVETHETSNHNTKGGPVIHLVFEEKGLLRIPIGLRVGIRLTPDGYWGGAGASYTGNIKLEIVTLPEWYKKALDGIPD